jgi:glutamate formiminotransferase/formiminotetrahydrofolate cyclodeaminase
MSMLNQKLEEFLEELASKTPTPGGGSVAALGGALGAGLVAMVFKLSDLNSKEAEGLRKELSGLIDKDIKAFDEVMKAYKIPKGQEGRGERIKSALKEAALVPLRTAELCLKVISLSREAAERGIKNAITDCGSAALIAEASLQAALLNAKINLNWLKCHDFDPKIKELSERGERQREEVLEIVKIKLR